MIKRKKQNYLEKIPITKCEHCLDQQDGLVKVRFINRGFYNYLAQKFFKTPKVSDIELDEFGSFIWLQIDGEKSILEIGKLVKGRFGLDAEPVYERISKYFCILENEKFIKFGD